MLDLLTEIGMLGCKLSNTSIVVEKKFEDLGKTEDRERHQMWKN